MAREFTEKRFVVADYLVFSVFLVVSLGIGLITTIQGRRNNNPSEYLVASQKLKVIPVAISIFVTYTNAVNILGAPGEVYHYGAEFWLNCLATAFGILLAALIFVPTFHRLKITSINAYFEARFQSRACRYVASVIGITTMVLWMSFSMMGPSVAFHTVTGFPTWAIIIVTALVTTIYTSLGGIKAVVWTDTFQGFVLIAGLLAIVIKANMDAGGLAEVLKIGIKHNRIKVPSFSMDPRVRNSVWAMVVGSIPATTVIFGTAQSSVQRMIALPTPQKARRAMLLNIPAAIVTSSFVILIGIAVFAVYAKYDCDILAAKVVPDPNQILPYYVMDGFSHLPGFAGMFMAVLYAGALSSMSTGLNSVAALIWDDYFVSLSGKHYSGSVGANINRAIVTTVGLLCMVIGIGVLYLKGTIIQIANMLLGCSSGPLLGMFCLGLFFPWSNAKGCLLGAAFGFILPLWITIGKFLRSFYGESLPPFTTEGCSAFLNNTTPFYNLSTHGSTFSFLQVTVEPYIKSNVWSLDELYKTSFFYISLIGLSTTIIFGLIFSFITGATRAREVDPRYIIPIFDHLCCCLPARCLHTFWCGVRHDRIQDEDSQEMHGKYFVDYGSAENKENHEIIEDYRADGKDKLNSD